MRLFRREWRDGDKIRTASNWTAEFCGPKGEEKRFACGRDKRAAAEIGRKLSDLCELQRARSVIPAETLDWIRALPLSMRDRMTKAGILGSTATVATSPLATLLEQWEAAIATRERTKKHVASVLRHARKVIDGCGFMTLGDLDSAKVERYLHQRRESGDLAYKTSNHALAATKGFVRWCAESGLQPADMLARVRPVNAKLDPCRVRRALTHAELSKLIATTNASPVSRCELSGPGRALLYVLACESGLRSSEIRSLRVDDFRLDGSAPSVSLRAADEKNRKGSTIPLRADTAKALADYFSVEGLGRAALAFPFTRERGARMLKADLEAAGLAYMDASGRYLDFHALRGQLATRVVESGASPRVFQSLMRHASASLTLEMYARLRPDDERRALEALERLAPTNAQQAQAQGA
jgi:integrase